METNWPISCDKLCHTSLQLSWKSRPWVVTSTVQTKILNLLVNENQLYITYYYNSDWSDEHTKVNNCILVLPNGYQASVLMLLLREWRLESGFVGINGEAPPTFESQHFRLVVFSYFASNSVFHFIKTILIHNCEKEALRIRLTSVICILKVLFHNITI